MSIQLIPEIHRLTHRIALHLEKPPKLGVTQGEAHILAHLAGPGSATVAELHRALAHKRSTLTSILDRLAARGLIKREVSPADRRMFLVTLTRAGRATALDVHRRLAALEAALLSAASRLKKGGPMEILRVLSAAAEAASKASGRATRKKPA